MSDNTRTSNTVDGEALQPPRLEEPPETEREITNFIREYVEKTTANGGVVNLSGGLDSTVTATLATEALGSENVVGLILPTDSNSDGNIDDARHVAEELAIDYHVIDVQPLLDPIVRALTGETQEIQRDPMSDSTTRITAPIKQRENHREAIGNATARLRMLIAYFEANTTSRLVLGTGNRTELLLGYFTKYGDGGVDLLPIGDLYKTETRDLAEHLGVRDRIIEKPPTAGLWAGQADENELGASYETIDALLRTLIDEDRSVDETAATLGVDQALVERFAEMVATAHHKRVPPPTPSTYPQDSGR